MADTDMQARVLAVSALLVGTGFPTETWGEVWNRIQNRDTPNSIEEVAELVDVLLALKPLILDDVVPVEPTHEFVDPAFAETPPPGGSSASDAKDTGQVKATRAKKVTDGGS